MAEEEKEIPASGAVFTFGRSRFADNIPSHFFIRNDPVIDVGCGDEHTAVVCQNGRVFVFGSNEWGQLGLGHRSVVTKPSCLKSLKPEHATHIACGRAHTIISTSSGKVYTCGSNSEGQLGVGATEDKDTPILVEGVSGTVEQLAAGCHHSVALNNKGEVFVWGSNADGQLGLGEDIKSSSFPVKLQLNESISKIACGYYHTVLLTEEGSVLVCGEGESGKLGLGTTVNVFNPTPVTLDAWPIYIAAGGNHTLVVAVDGKVYGWGSNQNGQLGLPVKDQSELLSATLIHSVADKVIREVSCGESHSAFVTEFGGLLVCGETRHGKLGIEGASGEPNFQSEPTTVPRFKSFCVTKVVCGGCHTMVMASPQTEDTLSNGHPTSNNTLQPPEVDIISPPIGIRGPLPPLQRVPHISASSMDDKISLSREDSMSSNPVAVIEVPDVPPSDVSMDSDVKDNVETDKEERLSLSGIKSTPDTVSMTEKSVGDNEEDNKSIKTMNHQVYDAMVIDPSPVDESCEDTITKQKSKFDMDPSCENGITKKLRNVQKKSKMCILL